MNNHLDRNLMENQNAEISKKKINVKKIIVHCVMDMAENEHEKKGDYAIKFGFGSKTQSFKRATE